MTPPPAPASDPALGAGYRTPAVRAEYPEPFIKQRLDPFYEEPLPPWGVALFVFLAMCFAGTLLLWCAGPTVAP